MHTNNFQCQHLWSLVGADGYRECLWCGEKLLHVPTTVSDNTKPLRPNYYSTSCFSLIRQPKLASRGAIVGKILHETWGCSDG